MVSTTSTPTTKMSANNMPNTETSITTEIYMTTMTNSPTVRPSTTVVPGPVVTSTKYVIIKKMAYNNKCFFYNVIKLWNN
jgi:hypothetical protein